MSTDETLALCSVVDLLRRGWVVEVGYDDADLGSAALQIRQQGSLAGSSRRAVRMSFAPWPASSRARAAPIPELAPVTNAHLPLNSFVFAIAES